MRKVQQEELTSGSIFERKFKQWVKGYIREKGKGGDLFVCNLGAHTIVFKTPTCLRCNHVKMRTNIDLHVT